MRNPASASSSSTAKTIATKTTPCCSKVGIKRGPWTPEEDEVLASYVKREGEGRWRTLPKRAGLQRCGKSCRLRWMNYLRPSVKRGHIAPDEEDLILRLHRLLGNRWSLIAGRIPGRTDNEIKNYWNTHLSKKLISQGIDPRTHKPLNPYPISSSAAQHKDTSSNIDASTSKNPKAPYPYPAPAVLEEISGGTDDPNKQKPDHQPQDGDGDCAGVGVGVIQVCNDQNWQNADELMMMMMGLHDKSTYVQRECLENCNNNNNEDVFSSFLDSLMEDDYANQYHHRPSNIAPPALPMTSSAAVPGFDNQVNAWESGLRPMGLVGESSSIGEQPNEVLHINHLP